MKRIIFIIMLAVALVSRATNQQEIERLQQLPPYERAVEIIKKYETLHKPKHWPLIGYGHKVMPGENYRKGVQLTEKQADELLRKDLDKMVDLFKDYGDDALLLGTLAYNIGPYKLLSAKSSDPKSSLLKKLKEGDRDIYKEFTSYCNYKGKPHKGLQQRRELEYQMLYNLVDEIENNENLDATEMLMDLNEINHIVFEQQHSINE